MYFFTEPSRNEPNLDSVSKKQICRDIISSHYIGSRLNYYLYDRTSCFHCFDRSIDDHPAKLIEVSANLYGNGENFQEWVFVCPVRRKSRIRSKEFYVSEAYKIGGGGDSSSTDDDDDFVVGRFIFRYFAKKIHLDGLAEPIATILSNTRADIEYIYLRRKENRQSGKKRTTA